MVRQEIALLTFYGGGTALTPAERAQAAAIVADGLRDNETVWRQADAGGAALLRRIAGRADPAGLARLRLAGRLNAQVGAPPLPGLAQEQAAEAAIIRAHDPEVVWDATSRRLITQTSVAAMIRADQDCAVLLGVAAPGPDAAGLLADRLRRSYSGMDQGMQQWIAGAEINADAAAAALRGMADAKRASFAATWRPRIDNASDPGERLLRLTQVVAGLGAQAAARTGAGASPGLRAALLSRLRQQGMMQNSLMGASRSFSPTCNVATGANQANISYCHPGP